MKTFGISCIVIGVTLMIASCAMHRNDGMGDLWRGVKHEYGKPRP